MKKRFIAAHSNLYGWCVYDTKRQCSPAYDACCDLLPRVAEGVAETPVLLKSEFAAIQLAMRLNCAERKVLRDEIRTVSEEHSNACRKSAS